MELALRVVCEADRGTKEQVAMTERVCRLCRSMRMQRSVQ